MSADTEGLDALLERLDVMGSDGWKAAAAIRGLRAELEAVATEGDAAHTECVRLTAQLEKAEQTIEDLSQRWDANRKDAERYRWLRSEEVATEPRYYEFWQKFNAKLCREGQMDAAIDAARKDEAGAAG